MAKFIEKQQEYSADIVIVGAGISGLTLAEQYARQGKSVLVIEKRHHIGGNCYDFINDHGIMVSLYGPHYFHTNDQGVWKYVTQFSEWTPYEHKVVGHVSGKKVPVPVNQTTINMLFGLDLHSEEEMKEWYEQNRTAIDNPKNAKEAVLARMGPDLYKFLFEGYTAKQWGLGPERAWS